MGCGCFVVLLGSAFPRLALVVTWIFTDRVDIAFDGWVLPLAGLIFLPYTTFFYVLAYRAHRRRDRFRLVPRGARLLARRLVLRGQRPHRHAALPLGVAHRPGPRRPRRDRASSGRAAQAVEQVDVLGEVPVTEELVLDPRSAGVAEPVGELRVVRRRAIAAAGASRS